MNLLTNREVKYYNKKLNWLKVGLVLYKLLVKIAPSLAKVYSRRLKRELNTTTLEIYSRFKEN